jgi:hypothetical protein
VERELGSGLSISLSGIYSHTLRLPVAIDTNALPAPFSTVPAAEAAHRLGRGNSEHGDR